MQQKKAMPKGHSSSINNTLLSINTQHAYILGYKFLVNTRMTVNSTFIEQTYAPN